MPRVIFICFLLLFMVVCAYPQKNSDKLRESREKALKEIEYANKLLLETQGKTKESLNEIDIISHKLAKRKEYLLGLEVEVNLIDNSIEKNLQLIAEIEREIVKIKRVYARMIVNLYKNKSSRYSTVYFVASENLNQMYKRIHTVKLYNSYLKQQKIKLDKLKSDLQKRNDELLSLKNEKDHIVNLTKKETALIQKEISEKNSKVKQLKQKQKEIEDDIKAKEKTAKKIEEELKKVIEEERRKARGSGKSLTNEEDKILSNDFEKNFGKLPWPTGKGIVTGKFGEHPHPDYKNVMVRNDGIYITTSAGESVRAVFKGVVSRVFSIPGENFTVIIKHGQYFSLYHNLTDVKIKRGQNVATKQIIGSVCTNNMTKETVLYFQIWKVTERSNPELWLEPL